MMRTLLISLLLVGCLPETEPAAPTGTQDASPGDDDDLTTGDDDDVTSPTGLPNDTGCAGTDLDDDGVSACEDCDDSDPLIYPGAPERCNGLDDDCDGSALSDEVDADSDGAMDCADCDAAGFWLSTRELSGAALASEVSDLVQPQTCHDYSATTTFMFVTLDKVGGQVEGVYTGRKVTVGSTKPDSDDMNTEHSWPQSKGADVEPPRCDLHHLFPTDSRTNSQRGNYDFGEVVNDTLTVDGDSRAGTDLNGKMVFEPRDVHKGNVARAMVYFGQRYGYAIEPDQMSIYTAWDQQDPVDEAELTRTWAIAAHQVLPNPFVVCPDLMGRL